MQDRFPLRTDRPALPGVVAGLALACLATAAPVAAQQDSVVSPTERGAGDVVAAIEDARRAIPLLETRAGWTVTDVEVVDVGTIVTEEEQGGMLEALERRAGDVEALRDAIDYSPVEIADPPGGGGVRLEEVLLERDVLLEDVVGVETTGETLVVFVWDRTLIADEAAEL